MKAERTMTKIAILFNVNGSVSGFEKHKNAIQRPKIIGPKTNI
jgi:hypothetical protein